MFTNQPSISGKQMSNSNQLFANAQQIIPGGVNSPVRAFKGVGGNPIFFESGQGAYLTSSDGEHYIDYVGSWGPLILGHADSDVIDAVQATAAKGLSFGAPTPLEITLAKLVCEIMPNIESVRMVNSGTEATMTAIRLARGFTGRNKFIKFEGCYHGHSDALLVKAGSGALTLGVPSSPGVPQGCTEDTLVATFNDLDSVTTLFEQYGNDIAGIIVEPIAGNMNCVLPQPKFLQGLRDICDQHQSLLIFDEVMTGFRVALGGAQSIYSIKPDLTTLGKIIGGGMPVGALGGRHDVMQHLAPVGPVYQAGTLSGNPIAMIAGITTLKKLQQPGFYENISQTTEKLLQGLQEIADHHGVAFTTNQSGSMFGLFFTTQTTVSNFQQATACDLNAFQCFYHSMLKSRIYLAPSAYEAGFVSCQHTEKEIAATLAAAEKAFAEVKNG